MKDDDVCGDRGGDRYTCQFKKGHAGPHGYDNPLGSARWGEQILQALLASIYKRPAMTAVAVAEQAALSGPMRNIDILRALDSGPYFKVFNGYPWGSPISLVEAKRKDCFTDDIAVALAKVGLASLMRPVYGCASLYYAHPKLMSAFREHGSPTWPETVTYLGRIKHKLLTDEPRHHKGSLPDFGWDE